MAFSSTTKGVTQQSVSVGVPKHPDYVYHLVDWELIRDGIAGERRVKEMGTVYLPSQSGVADQNYKSFRRRAVFVNMIARTISGLVGTVFRRELKIVGSNKRIRDMSQDVSIDGLGLNLFAKKLSYEIFGLGRVGVLVDRPKDPAGKPYTTVYIAENIIDWDTSMIKGRKVLTYVVLREVIDRGPTYETLTHPKTYSMYKPNRLQAQYRVLKLVNGKYTQEIYSPDDQGQVDLMRPADETIIPKRNGSPLNYIPMVIFGPMSPSPEVQRSPVIDITTLNFAHYRTSAQLEHGRFFTAMPIYYVPLGSGQGQAEYHLDPQVVWETPVDAKPGILEYFGTGLSELTKSMIEKEEAISNLGGRIMGIRSAGTTESEQVFKMKQANELSILLNVTEAMNAGLTTIFKWWLEWQDVKADKIKIALNQDFKSLNIASRELRAISLLYNEGVLPISEVYRVLQSAEFIDDNITLDEFTMMLNNSDKNFPNNPNVASRGEGYKDADARLRDTIDLRKDEREREKMSNDQEAVKREAKLKQEGDRATADLNDNMFKDGHNLRQFQDQPMEKNKNDDNNNK